MWVTVGGKIIHIGLVGNPNSGKSSLFNCLTGLNQQVGNFPGVTVELKVGEAKIDDNLWAEFIDLPGTYSLYPRRHDEQVTYDVLLNEDHEEHPDILVVIVDASNLKRNLIVCFADHRSENPNCYRINNDGPCPEKRGGDRCGRTGKRIWVCP